MEGGPITAMAIARAASQCSRAWMHSKKHGPEARVPSVSVPGIFLQMRHPTSGMLQAVTQKRTSAPVEGVSGSPFPWRPRGSV